MRESLDGKCLRNPRHAFEQRMTLAEQGDQAMRFEFFLSHHNLAHFTPEMLHQLGNAFHYFFSLILVPPAWENNFSFAA